MQEHLLTEIKMQLYFNHPNILKLYGIFNDKENVYLILEYMEEGTLYSGIQKKIELKQDDVGRKLCDVLNGLSYLHRQNIVVSNVNIL